ncbi:MAG: right-handed parallel beta-helix repeat-containing protein [Chloroflexi bacterium]|nr:right-handed parallel beta-helix repeat-containing protein [Chloroflexota bacterium]
MKFASQFSKLREASTRAAPSGTAGKKEEQDQSLRDLLRWLLMIPVILLLLFGCGTLGMFGLRSAQADTRSELDADYSPWPFTVFKPVNIEIIEEIKEDQILYPGTFAEPVELTIIPADFWFTPTPTPTLSPTSTGTLVLTSSPTPTPTGGTPTPTTTSTSTATPTESPTATPTATFTPSGPPAPIPPAIPPANTYWFYDDTLPATYMMYTTLATGAYRSSSSASFYSPWFSSGQSLNAGTTSVNFYASNPSPLASVFTAEMRAGGTSLGSGTFALPANTYDAYFFSASFATGSYNFADNDRLQVRFSFAAPAEIYWDSSYNYSGAAVPSITTNPTPTASPTASPTPSPSPTPSASPTPTNTALPTNTPTPTLISAAVTVGNVSAAEGAGLTFTVTLDNAVAGPFNVNVTLTDASATGGAAPLASPEDYNNVVAALNFAGTTGETQQFTVNTLDDLVLEGTETFSVSLNATDPLVTDTDTGIGTITDNDTAAITVNSISATEGSGLLFTVTLDNAVQAGFNVNVTLTDGTATGGAATLVYPEDYDNVVATLNFAGTAGESQQFTVATLDDAALEGTETFTVSLNATDPLVTDTDTGTGTITDNDGAQVTVDSISAAEGSGLLFTVTLDNAVASAFQVNVTLADASATGGAAPLAYPEDYDNIVAALNFVGSAGETRQFTVSTLDDVFLEGAETFILSLNATDPLVTDTDTGIGTLTDNDSAEVTVANVTEIEGTGLLFTVTLDNAVQSGFNVNITLVDASATGGAAALVYPEDYDNVVAALVFTGTAGETQQFTVDTLNDLVLEGTETFTASLSSTNALVTDTDTAAGIITDNDSAQVTVDDISVAEGSGLTFTVTLDNAVQAGFNVNVTLTDVSATGGAAALIYPEDYDNVVAALVFTGTAGETQQFTVDTLNDLVLEGTETFTVGLSSTNALVTDTDTGTGTITDNDSAAVTVDNVTASEGGGLLFTVTLDSATAGAFTVNVSLVDVSATGGSDPLVAPEDYDNDPVTLNFVGTGGETQQFTVSTLNDALVESTETFTVNLSSTDPLVTDTDTGTGTITNDDSVQISIDDVTQVETDSGTTLFTFTVSIDQADPSNPVTVDWTTANGTATTADSDYVAGGATLTFPAGTATLNQSVIITVNGDTAVEPNETFTVDLSGQSANATLLDNQGLGTIINDDSAIGAKIYWIDGGTQKIQRANLDGSSVEDLVTAADGLSDPRGLALDTLGGKMYWTDIPTGTIHRAGLDGTNVETLVSGLTNVRGIDLDVPAGKMYWTDDGTAKIQRANLDGSTVEDLVTSAGSPYRIALDVSGGKMYWTDPVSDEIRRANLDGTGVEPLVTGLSLPVGIELDVAGGKMYWTDLSARKIQRANLDGSSVQDLVTDPPSQLNETSGITLDLAAGKIYWTDYNFDWIRRANLDGTSVENVITTGLVAPGAIEMHSSAVTSVSMAAASSSVAEDVGIGSLDVTVVLNTTGALASAVTVDVVDLLSGSATPSGTDYTYASPTTVTFPIGSTNGATDTVTLTLINDTDVEPDETVDLQLQTVTGPASILGGSADHTVTITDNDNATITVDDVSAVEGLSLTFTISLDNAVAGGFNVDVTFTDVSATGGTDYANALQNVVFTGTPGETQTVTVTTTDDAILEGPETFTVNLAASDPSVTDTDTGTGTIIDNEGGPAWWNCGYDYRMPATVTAGSTGVGTGYAVSVTFNHSALVSASKSLPNGDDIRVTYWNGSSHVELDRFLDPGSSWNSTTTQIWFKTQAAIGVSSSDSDYYINYGNAGAGAPPANPSSIFFFFDGYESGDYTGWGGVSAQTGDTNTIVTTTVHTGTYASESFVDGGSGGGSYARVENNFAGEFAFHSTVWVYLPLTYNATDDITVLQFYTGGWTSKVASLSIRAPLADMRPFIANFNPDPAEFYFSATPLTLGAWHRLELKVDVASGRAEVWQDGVRTVNETGRDFGAGSIDHTVENIFWKAADTGPETMYFDDSFDKTWVDPEPTTSTGSEENSTCGTTTLYRSVGITATDLNISPRTVTISGTTATFSGAMPDNVGVGDVLTYNSGGNQLAFITGRTSDMVYTVADKDGGTPATASAGTAVGVYRAYTSLFNWEASSENPNITEPVENDVNPSTDLVSSNTVMMVSAYGDGTDTTGVTIDSWTTGTNNYIQIYTPVSSSEVGTSQRHSGVWDTSKYYIESGGRVLDIQEAYVRIEGLQIRQTSVSQNDDSGILVLAGSATSELYISHNIIRGVTSSSFWHTGIEISTVGPSSVAYIWNNIIYDFGDSGLGHAMNPTDPDLTSYIYNNTMYNNGNGLNHDSSGVAIGKNNISFSNTGSDYNGMDAASDNNLGEDAAFTGDGNYVQTSQTAAQMFVDPTGSPRDLHILSTSDAYNVGADLSGDGNLPFSDDIDLDTRSGSWDIGADENAPPGPAGSVNYRSIGTNAAILYQTGTATINSGSSTVTFGGSPTLPNDIGIGDELRIGATTFFILSRDSDTQVTVQETASSTLTNQTYEIYRAYTSPQAWEDARQGNLVSEDRREVGVLYADGTFTGPATEILQVNGSTTDATHYMEVIIGPGQQHDGTGGGLGTDVVVFDGADTTKHGVRIYDHFTRVQGLELKRFRSDNGSAGVHINDSITNVLLEDLLIHDFDHGTFSVTGVYGNNNSSYTVRNCIIYDGDTAGIRGQPGTIGTVQNCTIHGMVTYGVFEDTGTFTVTNTIAMNSSTDLNVVNGTQSNTLSSDGTGTIINKLDTDQFVSLTAGSEDFHLKTGSDAINVGTSLSGSFTDDIDGDSRPQGTEWEIGADEYIPPAGPAWWDTNYQYRAQITVSAGSAAVPSAYTVRAAFDHGSLTPAKSLPSGDDVRVVYWNGATNTELDRARDVFTPWEDTNTAVWFRTQAAISANGSDNNYYLYYGNSSAAAPPADKSQVFDLWDDFNDTANWTTWQDDSDSTTQTVSATASGGILSFDPGGSLLAGVQHNTYSPGNTYGFASRVRARSVSVMTDDIAPTCWYINAPLGETYCYQSRGSSARNRYVRKHDSGQSDGTDTNIEFETTTGPFPVADTWYRYEVHRLTDGTIQASREGSQQFPLSGWSAADTAISSGGFGLGGEGFSGETYEFDWAWARKLVEPEPTSALGSEEVQ